MAISAISKESATGVHQMAMASEKSAQMAIEMKDGIQQFILNIKEVL